MPTDTDREREDEIDAARVPADDVVDAIRSAPRPVVNTRHLADRFDVPLEEMFDRLDSLAADGVLDKLKVRGQFHLWELSREIDLELEE